MRLPLGPEFREQCERYRFRFCCEDCTYFDRERQRCVHGWPETQHRLATYREEGCRELVFCKEFELL
jgi:hypothetical protein